MNAELFCINTNVDVAGRLVRCLNDFVDPTVTLKVLNADTETLSGRYEIGQRYTKLLLASIPPERELRIAAVTQTELFGNRIYLRIYWPMLVEGYYSYPGINELVRGTYWTTYEQQFHARGRGLERFLPALAIRDRMVLVPKGQNETLEGLGPNEPHRPPLKRGVIEVDFGDTTELERAFTRVGEELREELRNELRAYQGFRMSEQSDFDTASALLGVAPSLLRRAILEKLEARELILNQIRCTVDPKTIVKDVQTRLSLKIENPSEINLGQLRVQLRGPSTSIEVNPERVNITLSPHGIAAADFSVAATREGEYVLEVLFLHVDIDVPRDMLPLQHLWITSVASR